MQREYNTTYVRRCKALYVFVSFCESYIQNVTMILISAIPSWTNQHQPNVRIVYTHTIPDRLTLLHLSSVFCIPLHYHLMCALLGQLFRDLHSMIVCESTRPVTNCKSHPHISVCHYFITTNRQPSQSR